MSRLARFTVTERLLHWGFAVGYLALLGSGLPLTFPALRGSIRGYAPVIGLRLHLALAVLWIVTVLVIVALGNRRALRATWRDLARFDGDDRAWLRRFPRWLVADAAARARLDRAVGRFNAGQKVNALFTVVTAGLLALTGLALWPTDGATLAAALTGPGSVTYWRVAHRWLTLVVLLPLAGHVYLAVFHSATRPSLRGMLDGDVDRAWAGEHHPRWCPPPSAREGDEREEIAS